jgi:hypothetical protein
VIVLAGFPLFDAVIRPPSYVQESIILSAMAICFFSVVLGVLGWALRGRHWEATAGIVLAVVAFVVLPLLGRA